MFQKLSATVIRKAISSIERTVWILCGFAGITILAIVSSFTMSNNKTGVNYYSAEINSMMQEKKAFIETVASGVNSGTIGDDYYAYVDQMVAQYDDVSAVYVCVEEEGTIYSDGIMTYMSGGWVPDEDFVVSDRAWYQGAQETDGVYVSEPYVDEQTGNICITMSKKVYKDGEPCGTVGLDMYMDDLVSDMEDTYDGGNYLFLVTADGTILTHPNEEWTLSASKSTSIEDALNGKYRKVYNKKLVSHTLFDYSHGLKLAISDTIDSTGWTIIEVRSTTGMLVAVFAILIVAVILAIVTGKVARKGLEKGVSPLFVPLEDLSANVSKISDGELDYNFRVDENSEEVNALSLALNDTIHNLQRYIAEIIDTVTAISEKNLNYTLEGHFSGDYEKIKMALMEIVEVLNASFMDVKEQAATVLESSENLSAASENVAEVATNQSEAVMTASTEMKRLTDNMDKIAEYANSIRENTDLTNEKLTIGNQEMEELVVAMDEISECYAEIAGFISEINSIATQTNLLALNASIEAARAGEAGKGFAVVATEIGALSQSSTESSDRISRAINRSLRSVEKGKNLVTKTSQSLEDSVSYSEENTKMVGEIVGFVETQQESANEIFNNLSSISESVENNAAIAEENSAISTSMGECARALMDTISQFQLKE